MAYLGRLSFAVLMCLQAGSLYSQTPDSSIPLSGESLQLDHEVEGSDPVALGDAAFESANYDTAVRVYQAVSPIEIPPYAQNRLGVAYHLLGRIREAEATYRVARARDPELSAVHGNLGAVNYARQNFRGAEDRFKDALELDPENTLLQYNLHAAKYARENGRESRGEAALRVAENPLLIDGRQGDLVRVKLLISDETIEELEDLEVRGDIFMARKMFEDAVIEYRRAIVIDDTNAVLMNKLGIAYHSSQQVRDAEKMYKESLDLNPYYLQALNNLGSIEHGRGRFDRAIGYYRRALEISPRSATVLQNLGACLFAMERYEDGLIAYQQAFRLDPGLFDRTEGAGTLIQTPYGNEAMSHFFIAKVFADSGDGDRAMSFLYRAVEEGFDDAQMLRDPAFEILAADERFLALLAGFEQS